VVREAHEIGVADLAPWAGRGLDGAVVLIRTGWGRLWDTDPGRYASVDEARPGLGRDAAVWLADQGVRAVGTDSFTIERWPPGGESAMPAHRVLLVDRGVLVFEALNLEELASIGATNFLFVALPLRLAGGSGSPVRPVAILAADDDGPVEP
jgi:kynurenine formamidase